MNPDVMFIDYINMLTSHETKSFRVMRVNAECMALDNAMKVTIWYDNVALKREDGSLECHLPEKCANRNDSCAKGCTCKDEEVSEFIIENALENV